MIRLTLSHMTKKKKNKIDFLWRYTVKYEIIAGMRKGRRGLKSPALQAEFLTDNVVINRL